VGTGWATWSHC